MTGQLDMDADTVDLGMRYVLQVSAFYETGTAENSSMVQKGEYAGLCRSV